MFSPFKSGRATTEEVVAEVAYRRKEERCAVSRLRRGRFVFVGRAVVFPNFFLVSMG